jgi:hypothetical protein
MYEDVLEEIVAEISSGNCVIFVGAGLSVGAGLPGWSELISRLAADLDCSLEDHDFLTIAQAYEYKFGRKALLSIVRECTDTSGRVPTPTHRALCALPSLGVWPWITTNYDDLLERSLEESGRPPCVVLRDKDVPATAGRSNVIVKIHGDVSEPETIVLTKNDYFVAPLTKPVVWNMLSNTLAQRTFLFLGYSMKDPDFTQLQGTLLHRLGTEAMKRSFALMFGPDEVVRADLASRNISIVDLGRADGEQATDLLRTFVLRVVQRLSLFPVVPQEFHGKPEAEVLVPEEVRQKLKNSGHELLCCIEYRVYCSFVDSGQSRTVPPGWRPVAPPDFRNSRYRCIIYTRQDASLSNQWEGLAVGELRSELNA